jgi:putative membrane protein
MLGHILLMNILAPAIVLFCRAADFATPRAIHHRWISAATMIQIAVLWGWHLPIAVEWAAGSAVVMAAMSLSLFAVALFFWFTIFAAVGHARWRALGSLLITGKLFCLLGILLTFAPRLLYSTSHAHHADPLSDQQLGGLLMLIACPLTYVLAAVIISARWLTEIDRSAQAKASSGTA